MVLQGLRIPHFYFFFSYSLFFSSIRGLGLSCSILADKSIDIQFDCWFKKQPQLNHHLKPWNLVHHSFSVSLWDWSSIQFQVRFVFPLDSFLALLLNSHDIDLPFRFLQKFFAGPFLASCAAFLWGPDFIFSLHLLDCEWLTTLWTSSHIHGIFQTRRNSREQFSNQLFTAFFKKKQTESNNSINACTLRFGNILNVTCFSSFCFFAYSLSR